MIQADVGIHLATLGRNKRGVGGQRAFHGESSGAGGIDSRLDDAFFFPLAEEAVFSGVGIETEDGDLGSFAFDSLDRLLGDLLLRYTSMENYGNRR